MPRLRSSAARSTFALPSRNVSSPHVMTPASGFTNPAMDMSVVVFPQPDGPSKVTNSLSLTVKLTSSRPRCSPYDFTRCSARSWGMAGSRDGTPANGEHDGDDEDLDDGQRGDGTGHAPLKV